MWKQTIDEIGGFRISRLKRYAIPHQLNGEKHTRSAYTANETIFLYQFAQAVQPLIANVQRVFLQSFVSIL